MFGTAAFPVIPMADDSITRLIHPDYRAPAGFEALTAILFAGAEHRRRLGVHDGDARRKGQGPFCAVAGGVGERIGSAVAGHRDVAERTVGVHGHAAVGEGIEQDADLAGFGCGRDVAAAGLVDELNLTVSPQLNGGNGPRLTAGAPDLVAPMQLAHVLEDNGFLFTRYVRQAA